MQETQVIVIRHGETEWNLANRYQGQIDSPLSVRGRQQVEAIGKRLATQPFDALYSSDLGRAMDTAGAIARCSGVSGSCIIKESGFRERHYGILGGARVFAICMLVVSLVLIGSLRLMLGSVLSSSLMVGCWERCFAMCLVWIWLGRRITAFLTRLIMSFVTQGVSGRW